MPVYTVYATADHLSPAIKADVARGITRVHSELTGTPRFLAQVIFQDVSAGNFFLGGNPQRAVNVFVHAKRVVAVRPNASAN
jgi:phenylpyruvate tautomerase PptA (4-oxalocrotonate tautomerase family)